MWGDNESENWTRSLMLALEVICETLPWRQASEIMDPSNRNADVVTLRRIMFFVFVRDGDVTVPDLMAGTGCSRQSVERGIEHVTDQIAVDENFATFVEKYRKSLWGRY